jgi:hypothetical protein
LARAKNTSRAEARKRTRDAQRAELAEHEALDDQLDGQPEDAQPAARPRLFQMPNVREDIRALPGMFRAKPLLWLPLFLLIGGLLMVLGRLELDLGLTGTVAAFYLSMLFAPPALFTFFIAGFLAPRASWLVGLIYGAIAGTFWFIAFVPPAEVPDTQTFVAVLVSIASNGMVYGTLSAAFAAWYRNFLRGMQQSGQQRRADREARERAKRREERQESRRAFKQRSS